MLVIFVVNDFKSEHSTTYARLYFQNDIMYQLVPANPVRRHEKKMNAIEMLQKPMRHGP